jgi:hypothetical protein
MKHEEIISTFELKINKSQDLDKDSEEFKADIIEIRSFLFGLFEELTHLSEEIKQSVIKSFEKIPEIYADIVSAIDSPNCTCRGRVANFFQENPVINLDIFKKTLQIYPQNEDFYNKIFERIRSVVITNNVQNIEPNKIPTENNKSLVGRIISIKSHQEYYKVIQSLLMQNYHYNGISIVENNEEIKLYFY